MSKRTQLNSGSHSTPVDAQDAESRKAPGLIMAATKKVSKAKAKPAKKTATKSPDKTSDAKKTAQSAAAKPSTTVKKIPVTPKKEDKKVAPSSNKPDVSSVQKKVVVGKKLTDAPSSRQAATSASETPKTTPTAIKVEAKIIEAPVPEFKSRPVDESLFSKDELETFRSLLLSERGKILTKARKTMEEGNIQIDKNEMFDEVDQAAAMIDQNLTFRLLDRDRKLLTEIDHALAKIDSGDYGYCEGTGEPIPKRRLELRPWCRHSVKYKERLERMKKSGRGVVDEDEI